MDNRRRAGLVRLLLLVAVSGAVAWSMRTFYSDDAQISLRYADRLLRGEGLTWTDGERVEGYSNLLWVLLVAALGGLGVDLMDATRVLGAVGLVGLLWAASAGEDGWPDPKRALSGGAFLALSGGFAVWVVGGLAHTFLSAVGLLALRVLRRGEERRFLIAGSALLAVAALLRVDGMVLAAAVLAGALARGLPIRRVALAGVGPALAVAGQQAFRVLYYDDWVPNTARVKVSFTLERAEHGAWWVLDAWFDHGLLLLAGLAALAVLRRRGADGAVAAAIWTAYAAYVGGDIFRGWRMLLPGIPLLAVLIADASDRLGRRTWAALALALALHGGWNLTRADAYRRPVGPDWTITTKAVAKVLRYAFRDDDPLLAVDAAGALPYFTRFRAVDMLGLTDRYLPRHPPPGWGKGGIGHDLGDGAYILGRKPDIVAFRSGLGGEPLFLSGRQMAASPTWARDYRPAVIQARYDGEPVRALYYFRVADGPLAPVRSPHEVRVPGHLFGTHAHPAVLRNDGLGPVVPKDGGFEVSFELAPGRWSVELLGGGPLRGPEVVVPRDGVATIAVRAVGKPAHLTGIRLLRDTAHAQLNERVEGQFLGQNWNRARTTEADRIAELEALGYVSGSEAPAAVVGVTAHTDAAWDGLNLYVSGHDATAVLLDMDGTVRHTWRKPWREAFPERAANGERGPGFWRRAHLLADGSLLAIYDGYGLVKLDRDSNVVWAWAEPAHHDLEVLPDGRIWVLARKARRIERIHPDEPVLEDFAVLLSPDGVEQRRISVLDAVERSSASSSLFAAREETYADVLHTNTLEVLDGRVENPLFAKGRLLLSARSTSMLFVLDPDTEQVVWAHTGAYRFQHDPTITADGHLLVFDNSGPGGLRSAVREYDPTDMREVWRYVGSDAEPFFSRYCGAVYRLPNGNTLIVESGVGRVFERTPDGRIAWEFNSPHRTGDDGEFVAIVPDLVRIPLERAAWLGAVSP